MVNIDASLVNYETTYHAHDERQSKSQQPPLHWLCPLWAVDKFNLTTWH